MILLGIVGTPASGKSTVSEYLQSKGAHWVNADLIARDVLTQPDVIETLRGHFGDSIVDASGGIDRSALAKLVFGNTPDKMAALDFLESIVHPITRLRITDQIKHAARDGAVLAILDIPLLFEAKWDRSCDAIWCVDAPRQRRMDWSASRGWAADELDRRESNQLSIAEKRRLSNYFVQNDATLDDLFQLLDHHWTNLATMGGVLLDTPDSGHCFSD